MEGPTVRRNKKAGREDRPILYSVRRHSNPARRQKSAVGCRFPVGFFDFFYCTPESAGRGRFEDPGFMFASERTLGSDRSHEWT
jgi:hypothetical protein